MLRGHLCSAVSAAQMQTLPRVGLAALDSTMPGDCAVPIALAATCSRTSNNTALQVHMHTFPGKPENLSRI